MDPGPLSEYELIRERNIAAFREAYKKVFGEEPGQSKKNPYDTQPSTSKPRPTGTVPRKRRSSRKIPLSPVRRSKRLSGLGPLSDTDDSDIEKNGFRGFTEPYYKRRGRRWKSARQKYFLLDDTSDDSDYEINGFRGFKNSEHTHEKKRKKHKSYTPRISLKSDRYIPKPEEISDSDIENIFYRSAGKQYDTSGTTCHQCRQKTKDTKSICRGEECSGVRGQFCGFCLMKRYGEDVAEVLKDPNWICPPCRGICNCSICRRRQGKIPTGILVPQAIESGFDNVKEFLEHTNQL